MIVFKKLRYQNILSTGNAFTEIDFLKSKTTLLVGSNGAGKSTFIDALTFCLFGKAFRKITLNQLINSMTNKALLTEVEFSIGSNEYMIRRGMKPTVFEIYKNGELRKAEGAREDQKYLEEKILKMSFKTFSQIVVLGSTNYTPFMLLPAAERRAVVENLLDIQIFTVMNTLLKSRVDRNKDDLNEIDHKISLCESKIELEQKHLTTLKSNNDELINQKSEKISEAEDLIETNRSKVQELLQQIDALSIDKGDEDKALKRKSKLVQFEVSLEEKKKTLLREIEFFHDHDNCPTCKQQIDEVFKEETVTQRKCKVEELDSGLVKLEEELNAVSDQIKAITQINRQISDLNSEISEINQQIRFTNNYIQDLQRELDTLKKQVKAIDTQSLDLDSHKSELKQLSLEKKDLIEEKAVLAVGAKLLKDSGVKTKIINQYIPVMNKLINKYLSQMELFVEFNLDENFNESVKSRGCDTYCFENFSEGEKMRITLAILFTWRAIAKKRNSASTNLLVMDEVFDGSTDSVGVENITNIIEELTKDSNVFIISHKDDMIYDRFESVLRFEKHNNFSRIVE